MDFDSDDYGVEGSYPLGEEPGHMWTDYPGDEPGYNILNAAMRGLRLQEGECSSRLVYLCSYRFLATYPVFPFGDDYSIKQETAQTDVVIDSSIGEDEENMVIDFDDTRLESPFGGWHLQGTAQTDVDIDSSIVEGGSIGEIEENMDTMIANFGRNGQDLRSASDGSSKSIGTWFCSSIPDPDLSIRQARQQFSCDATTTSAQTQGSRGSRGSERSQVTRNSSASSIGSLKQRPRLPPPSKESNSGNLSPTKSVSNCSESTATTASTSASDDSSEAPAKKKTEEKRVRRKEPAEKIYKRFTESDVLMGRGGQTNRHPGNIAYRKHVLKLQKEYKKLENTEKTKMSKEVFKWVKTNQEGHFLAPEKIEAEDGSSSISYYVASEEMALEKIRQALREDHTSEGRDLKQSRLKGGAATATTKTKKKGTTKKK